MKSINEFDLDEVIRSLSEDRPVFHSEADFQFELARKIEKEYKVDVRLEKPEVFERRIYIDMVLKDGEDKIAIELKYKTKKAEWDINGELFKLTYHSAQDFGRYYYWRDIDRIQKLVKDKGYKKGFAVFLTNDSSYWDKREGNSGDKDFSLDCGRTIEKETYLSWEDGDPRKNQYNPFQTDQEYRLEWKEYGNGKGFKYLICEIDNKRLALHA